MLVMKSYVFRLYPNNKQRELINKTFGCTRFVYNTFLDSKKKQYENTGKSDGVYDQIRQLPALTSEYKWLKEVDSQSLTNALFNLNDAYKRFFREEAGYPKFRVKGRHDSYKANNIKSNYKGKRYESIMLDLENNVITLPKLKNVKIRGYRNLDKIGGNIRSATIKRNANKYYVSVLVEEEMPEVSIVPNSIVGIDLGIKDFIVTSNGEKLKDNSKEQKKVEKRIKGLQKAIARCQKGSKNRKKLILKLRRAYQKLKNMRKHLIHTVTNKLLDDNDIIVTEDLSITNMMATHNIAASLTNIPLYEFIRTLKYKAKWRGKKVFQVDRYYASSQICNICDYKNEKVKDLSVRKWECPKCHHIHDRDLNASINIMFEGLKMYMKQLEI